MEEELLFQLPGLLAMREARSPLWPDSSIRMNNCQVNCKSCDDVNQNMLIGGRKLFYVRDSFRNQHDNGNLQFVFDVFCNNKENNVFKDALGVC